MSAGDQTVGRIGNGVQYEINSINRVIDYRYHCFLPIFVISLPELLVKD